MFIDLHDSFDFLHQLAQSQHWKYMDSVIDSMYNYYAVIIYKEN